MSPVQGLSQEALAVDAGVDRTYVSSIGRAEPNVSIDNIARIARAWRSGLGIC